jgi:hypothetical protein
MKPRIATLAANARLVAELSPKAYEIALEEIRKVMAGKP